MSALAAAPSSVAARRAARLREYGVLEAARPLPALEDLVRRAQEATRFPVAWISFLDAAHEVMHVARGIALQRLEPQASLAFALADGTEPVVIEDALRSPWRAHPMVAGPPYARSIAVVPLAGLDGLVVGTLTVVDRKPRVLTPTQRTALSNLALLAVARLEARRTAPEAASQAPTRPLLERLEEEERGRRVAEEALQRERGLLDAVLESLSSAFFLVSSDGAMLRWNASLATAIGYTDAEIARMHPGDFVSPHDRPIVEAALREVLVEGREVALETEIVDRAGNVRPFALEGRPLELGGERYMIGVAGDITLRKRTERQMARAKERLDLALSSSRLALWDWDLRADKVYFNESWAALRGEPQREITCWAARSRPGSIPTTATSSRPRSATPPRV